MNFDAVACDQPDLTAGTIACVDQSNAVLGGRVEVCVAHAERLVAERFRVSPPGLAPLRLILETDAAAHQVRLARKVAQVVIEAAWPGIGPIQNAIDLYGIA